MAQTEHPCVCRLRKCHQAHDLSLVSKKPQPQHEVSEEKGTLVSTGIGSYNVYGAPQLLAPPGPNLVGHILSF